MLILRNKGFHEITGKTNLVLSRQISIINSCSKIHTIRYVFERIYDYFLGQGDLSRHKEVTGRKNPKCKS